MASRSSKHEARRYIICGLEGQEPVQTDNFERCKEYLAVELYWVIDTHTGCYIELDGTECPMEDIQ